MPKAIIGVTDLWTTNPPVAQMLLDKDFGHRVTINSHKRADFICPVCNTIIKNKIIRNVVRNGLKCSACSDGFSYPEKFISVLLNKLNIEYIHDNTLSWSNNKRYDFYIPLIDTIIETHGIQHYDLRRGFNISNNRDEKQNDKQKKELALSNGIKHYIELDCSKSEKEYVVNSILKSDLNSLLNLSEIDWNEIQTNVLTLKSKLVRSCELYKQGITTHQIAIQLYIDDSTVIDYLKKGTQVGLCDYSYSKCKKIICVELNKIYDSLNDAAKDGFNVSQISECCHGKANTAGGYNWCFLDLYNPLTYQLKIPLDTSNKKVLCIETNKIYDKLSDVKFDNYNPSAVSMVCNGKRNIHKGCHWKYLN